LLLCIDIGNSNLAIGVFDGNTLCLRGKASAAAERSSDEYAVLLYDLLRLNKLDPSSLTGCILASVVPSRTGLVEEAVKKLADVPVMKVGPGIKTGFRIRIDDPSQLGADLVADTAAALAEYGAPLILVDVGTVITMAAIDSESNYLGGCIMPGLYGSAELLKNSTALLPSIALHSVGESALGRNTADAMRCGLLHGYAMMVDGFISRYEKLPKMAGAKTVATGGSMETVTAGCSHEIIRDRDLTLKGLCRLYEINSAKR